MDARLRDVERAFLTSGAPEAEARYLRELVRQGELPLERLELAAFLGHPPARQALADTPRPALEAEELSRVLDRSAARIGRWTEAGCPSSEEGGRVVYRLGDVAEWLLRREVKPDPSLEVAVLHHWHHEAPARVGLGMLAWLLEDWVGLEDRGAGGLSATWDMVVTWLAEGPPDDAEAQVMSLIEAASPQEVRPEVIGVVSILLKGVGYARDDVGFYRLYCAEALHWPWQRLLEDAPDPLQAPPAAQRAAYLRTWWAAGARTIPWALGRSG